jgi:hypothetical protein
MKINEDAVFLMLLKYVDARFELVYDLPMYVLVFTYCTYGRAVRTYSYEPRVYVETAFVFVRSRRRERCSGVYD